MQTQEHKRHKTGCSSKKMDKLPPPWQVLDLVAHHLDPKTLATATCVCKSWSLSMSSDHLWHPIFTTTYPSLLNLRDAAAPTLLPYHKLYSLGRAADHRRLKKPPKPQLSMHDLIFAIHVHNGGDSVATVVRPVGGLKLDENGLFRLDIDVDGNSSVAFEAVDKVRVTWNVVLEGFKGVFTMMDCMGKGKFVLGMEGWFSKELPLSPGCCGGEGSGMVADLRLGLREIGGRGEKVVVESVSVGVLSVVSWRYVCVDDALRYLQHFLLPM